MQPLGDVFIVVYIWSITTDSMFHFIFTVTGLNIHGIYMVKKAGGNVI